MIVAVAVCPESPELCWRCCRVQDGEVFACFVPARRLSLSALLSSAFCCPLHLPHPVSLHRELSGTQAHLQGRQFTRHRERVTGLLLVVISVRAISLPHVVLRSRDVQQQVFRYSTTNLGSLLRDTFRHRFPTPLPFLFYFFSPKGTVGLLTARLLLRESSTLTHVRD